MSLTNLCGPNKPLKQEAFDGQEFEGLKWSGQARLRDAQNTTLSLESRFDLAYNAAHAFSLAGLRWHGYRASNRYIVFQVLPDTLNLGPSIWRVLAKCHEVRNLAEYEGHLSIDERLVLDLISACELVHEKVNELNTDRPN